MALSCLCVQFRECDPIPVTVEFPLVFWRWADEVDGPVKHRSYLASRDLFGVTEHAPPPQPVRESSPTSDDESDDWASFDDGAYPTSLKLTSPTSSTPTSDELSAAAAVDEDDFDFSPPVALTPVPSDPAEPVPAPPLSIFTARPPKVTIMGKQRESIDVDNLTMSQGLHLENVSHCVVACHAKINSIMLSGCDNVALRFLGVISTCEVVNSHHVHVACAASGSSTFTVDGSHEVLLSFPSTVPETLITSSDTRDLTVVACSDPMARIPWTMDALPATDAPRDLLPPAADDVSADDASSSEPVVTRLLASPGQHVTRWVGGSPGTFHTEMVTRATHGGYMDNFQS